MLLLWTTILYVFSCKDQSRFKCNFDSLVIWFDWPKLSVAYEVGIWKKTKNIKIKNENILSCRVHCYYPIQQKFEENGNAKQIQDFHIGLRYMQRFIRHVMLAHVSETSLEILLTVFLVSRKIMGGWLHIIYVLQNML